MDTGRESQQVTLRDGRRLGYAEYGNHDGKPLLLFHGTPGSRIFNRLKQASWVESHGLRVITPERPGYGLSDPAPGRTIKDWADDVAQLADHLGLHRFHVAGGSGGGPYALACAIQIPSRILSATLFCSGCPPEILRLSKDMYAGNRVGFFLARYAPFLLKAMVSINARSIRKDPESFVRKLRSSMPAWDQRAMEGEGVAATAMQLKEAFCQGFEGAYQDMLLVSRPWDLDLDDITLPAFLWHGTADTLVPASSARVFGQHIPGCEAHFVPDAGHMLLANEDVATQIASRMLSVGDRAIRPSLA